MKRLLLAVLLCPAALAAQAQPAAVSKDAPAADADVAAQRELWRNTIRHITVAAEEWPEADYNWKPVETVRGFGALIAHVAGSQYAFCAPALGENRDADEANVERTATTKAAIVAALKASTEYCDRAYRINDAAAARPASIFGMNRTGLYALAWNANHNSEHYGNVITYMRMRGMVPPSSRPRQGQ